MGQGPEQTAVVLPTRFFLWHGHALYVGISPPSSLHQHHAIQIGVGLDGTLRFRTRQQDLYARCDGFLLRPDQPHQVDGAAALAVFLWLEPESALARALLHQASPNGMFTAAQREIVMGQRLALLELAQQASDCASATALVAHLLDIFAGPPGVHAALHARDNLHTVDPRIVQTLSRLSHEARTASAPAPALHHLTHDVALSSSRLRHIFAEQLGLSMQSYLLWQRLLVAIELSTHGLSLTQAAHDAGFADAAHLTRTFRRMFGVKPSDVFRDSHSVQVFPCLH